jgi:hypothetical protein
MMETETRDQLLARFTRTGNRTMGAYLTGELTALADLAYQGVIPDGTQFHDIGEVRRTLASLERFKLADHGHLYDQPTTHGERRWLSWGWAITDAGREVLDARRPYRYRCCEWAIRVPCVCSESVYCPDPTHPGGCHGTHD